MQTLKVILIFGCLLVAFAVSENETEHETTFATTPSTTPPHINDKPDHHEDALVVSTQKIQHEETTFATTPSTTPHHIIDKSDHHEDALVVATHGAYVYDPTHDTEALKKAFDGIVVNEIQIIDVLTNRNSEERLKIVEKYFQLYNKHIIDEIDLKLKSQFKDVITALVLSLPLYYAKELFDAMHGIGTDEDCLIEVLCTLSSEEIKEISDVYQETFGASLQSHIYGDTDGSFGKLMLGLSKSQRNESMSINKTQAGADAEKLYNAGVKKIGTDDSVFIDILSLNNYNQLRLIFEEYKHLAGHDIADGIKKEFSGHIKDALLAIVSAVRDMAGFFAERLYQSMSGLGTNNRQLIRIIVTRKEFNIHDIKLSYVKRYGISLAEAISDDTSGYFQKCLLALIGEFHN